MIAFYSSSNGVVNTRRAVAECMENALAPDDTDCDLIVFHTTVGHSFNELLSEMQRFAPNARIVGCTGSGIIGKEGHNETMRALAVMALRCRKQDFAVTSLDTLIDIDSYQAGVRIAADLVRQNADINIILIFPSAVDVYPADRLIAGIESILGTQIPIIGGCAADNSKFISSWQFIDNRVLERGAVAVGLADPTLHVVMGKDHGYQAIGDPATVTRSEINRVFELDGTSAWPLLAEKAGIDVSTDPKSAAASALWAIAVEPPLELREMYDTPYTLHLGGPIHQPDGSILIGETCPVGTKIWLVQRDEEQLFNGTDRIIGEIVEEGARFSKGPPAAVFHADCAARGRFMFSRFLKEEIVTRMQQPLCGNNDVPWLGFYSGGEFCKIGDRNRFHAFTSSIFALYRRHETEK